MIYFSRGQSLYLLFIVLSSVIWSYSHTCV